MKLIAIYDGHNSSAAYMEDGEVKFAIQEERLSRVKNAGGFPRLAIEEILKRRNLKITGIDAFVFVGRTSAYDLVSREAVLEKYAKFFDPRIDVFQFIINRFKKLVKKAIRYESSAYYDKIAAIRKKPLLAMGADDKKISFIDHHLCHAAAAAYGWGKNERIAVVTADSAGDGLSGRVWLFNDGELLPQADIGAADSIGRLYSLVTYYLGMAPMEHEYKIMGLAPYSEKSSQAREIADYFHGLFEHNHGGLTYKRRIGIEPVYNFGERLRKFLAFRRFDNISAGLQLFTEEFVSEWIKNIMIALRADKIALGGGLFMNVKLNKRIMELPGVKDMFVFPSCGDESNVFGALYVYWHQKTGQLPKPLSDYYLGGDFSEPEIKSAIERHDFKNCRVKHQKLDGIEAKVAELLSRKKIVARFDGRMEFGARALGNRSILANPFDPSSVKTINLMIKSRDFWMPFAPSLLEGNRYIKNPKGVKAPYMVLTFDVPEIYADKLTSVTHPYDNTCRPQEVNKEWNPKYWQVIDEFKKLTGESIVLNTSLNLHGFPVVYAPQDALFVFDNSGLEYLVLGDYLVEKIKN